MYKLPFAQVFPHAATVPLVGTAQGALDDYLVGQRDRVRMLGGNVAAEPTTQIRVAESAADVDAARLSVARNFAEITALAAARKVYPSEFLARIDRDQVLATRKAVTTVDRIFANAGARALSLDNPIQRAWRDVHAGAAHAGNVPEPKLSGYGALAFGLPPAAH
jgi:3-hydroxy-9,10-secoandrosta-1,3,5(10)-triene-9,17-dione monooxygenase